jgi:hypothetical protein
VTFDFDRACDWLHAVERCEAGDARALAAFVLRYGIDSADERREVARMLTSKPDARRGTKAGTQAMLRELDRMLRLRDEVPQAVTPWVRRLRRRLAAHLSAEQVEALLRRHRPGYLRPKPPTLDTIYTAIAQRHRVTTDAVRKLHRRHRR